MLKVAFYTFGCRTNQYDTEMMKEKLRERRSRISITPFNDGADIYIINTCAVTTRSCQQARQFIRKIARRRQQASASQLLLVTGCYADVSPEEVYAVGGVDLVFGNPHKIELLKLLERALQGEKGIIKSAFAERDSLNSERISQAAGHQRALVKIQDGCAQFCSFCKAIYARGAPRSKTPENIVAEVKKLVANGYPEIVFTGINLALYGKDLNLNLKGEPLVEVLEKVAAIGGLRRIRLSSINLSGITKGLVEFFKSERKACPYFHIPLQSGDDQILKRMKRGYSTNGFRDTVKYIRENIEKATLGTDVMVGFPGEEEQHFENTCKFVAEIGFVNTHIFRYSKRPGTAAASFSNEVNGLVKRARARRLRRIADLTSWKVKKGFVGEQLEVLVENVEDGRWRGYSENYLDVHIANGTELKPSQIVKVEITEAKRDHLLGEIIPS